MIDFGHRRGEEPVMHCQHCAAYYIHQVRNMRFETIRAEREAAALHWAYANAARSAAFAKTMFRYSS